MANYLEERVFFKGGNADDELRSIPNGDYLLDQTYNIRIYDSGPNNVGVIKNIKGTQEISFQLPAGRNVCIGAPEIQETQTIFYFIFNDLGNHGVYYYDPTNQSALIQTVIQDPILGFKEFNRINHANLVGGKLLYWTDGGIPKKLNILKALENKARIYNVNFGSLSAKGERYVFNVNDSNGTTVFTWNTLSIKPSAGTIADAFYLSHYLESNFPINAFVSVKAVGATLQITFKNTGKYTIVVSSFLINNSLPNQSIAVALNFYPSPYSFDLIDRLKYPPQFQPGADYKMDSTKDTNYVQNRIFQFAIQYIYDDDEPSTLSPISVIPGFGAQCMQSIQQSLYNYIEVNFTDKRLNNPVSRSIIQYVNIYFRQDNAGKFQLIQTLQPFEFGIGLNTFNFYNDGIYKVLDDTTASMLFSSVPIENGAQEYIGDRIVDSDILEGYDNVPIDAELKVDYAQPSLNVFDLKGIVKIAAFIDPATPWFVPVADYPGNTRNITGITFGGLRDEPFGGFGPTSDLNTRYFQSIPLAGFVFYLAGTDYYGVSKQHFIGTPSQDSTTGVCHLSSQIHLNEVKPIIKSQGGFYSDWVIKGVPPGVYSLRVASHLTEDADLINNTRAYQRKSTTVCTNGFSGISTGLMGSSKTEVIVEILATGVINLRDPDTFNIIQANYNGNGTSYVQDVSVAAQTGDAGVDANGIMGYIVDGETLAAPPDAGTIGFYKMLEHERITRALVTIAYIDTSHNGHLVPIRTDHNGFFFDSQNNITIGHDILEYELQTTQVGSLTDVINTMYNFSNYPNTFTTVSAASHQVNFGIRFFNNQNLTDNFRTFIDGTVLDINNVPVSGITVVIPYHGAAVTDSSGRYTLSFYTYVNGNNLLIIASPSALCSFDISTIPQVINGLIINISNYNNLNHKIATDLLAMLSAGTSSNAFKRGGNWQMGIVYYDRGLRSGTVNNTEKTNLSVVFYTETDPAINAIPNKGEPIVSWKVRNTPPAWATHWQWVRTQNLAISYYLQFIANKADYTDTPSEGASATTYALGNYLRIDLTNIVTYSDINKSSLVAYTWQRGDRIRFIQDQNSNYFNQYFDYEIVFQDGNSIFIVKDLSLPQLFSGVMFEIYTPRLNAVNKIFYEIGEEFEVGVDTQGRTYHKGLTTNQNPVTPYNVPATGTFRTGDAWYRKRSIPYFPATATIRKTVAIDDQSVSDFYVSKDDNIGRINILNLSNQQLRREKTLRHSGVYVQDTRTNLLSWNIATDTVDIDKGEGHVTKLQVAGRILLAYQPSRVHSVYINEIQYIDASGNRTLTKSDTFIGSVNPLELLSGTLNPESVKERKGNVLHFDRINGMFVRYALNGLYPVSNYKAVSYAWKKSNELKGINNTGVYALGFINPSQNEYGVTFVDLKNNVPLIKQETIAFVDEPTNRWTTKYTFLQEQYCYSGGTLVSFKNGRLWLHDQSSIYNNFAGVQYNSKLTFVGNQANDKMRKFMALVIDGSEVWSCPDDDSITVPPSQAYPQGMASRLLKNLFRRVGTDWYAPFKKDLNTPNMTSNQIINGRDLAGHVIVISLINDSTKEVTLKSVGVRYTIEEFTKK